MPTATRKHGTRLSDDSAELVYLVTGTTDETAARSTLAAEAPTLLDGRARDSLEVVEFDERDDHWLGFARYKADDADHDGSAPAVPEDVGDSTFTFNVGAGTSRVLTSLDTVGAYGTGATTNDNGGLVNATPDGVEGVDIVTPTYEWAETHVLADSAITLAYRGTLFGLVGKVNNASFKGTAAGETLFLGATGQQRADGPWTITYSFASRPNVTGRTIGSINGIAVKGWEHVWVRSRPKLIAGLGEIGREPVAVYVERLYDSASFSGLGIGT
jgi:hypothetical protein